MAPVLQTLKGSNLVVCCVDVVYNCAAKYSLECMYVAAGFVHFKTFAYNICKTPLNSQSRCIPLALIFKCHTPIAEEGDLKTKIPGDGRKMSKVITESDLDLDYHSLPSPEEFAKEAIFEWYSSERCLYAGKGLLSIPSHLGRIAQ
jgi:hypothetical protein